MRPITLKIKGINSFIEEQFIDFNKLMSYGLFGITGNTGSGKSTILDAITLALYDKIPRKSNNYINTSQKSGEVSFEFQINSAVSKTYIVERKYTKTEKDNVSSAYARLYEKSENETTVIAVKPSQVTKSVEQIIGLNYEDFTRSVVLPQGKFSEFLSLQGRQRNDMLERLFGLERIGENLQTKIRDSLKDTENELAQTENNIEIYGNITEKDIENLSVEIDIDETNYNILDKRLKTATALLEENKVIFEQHKELQSYINKMNILEVNKNDYKIIEARIADAEKAQEIYPYYTNLIETENKILKINSDINENNKQKKSIEESIIKAQSDYEARKIERETLLPQLIELELKISDAIKLNKELKFMQEEREKLLDEYNLKNTSLLSAKKSYENITKTIQALDKSIVTVKENIKKNTVNHIKREAIAQGVEIEKSIDKISKEILQKETSIKRCSEEIEKNKLDLCDSEAKISENDKKSIDINELLEKVNQKLMGLPQKLMDLNQTILELNIKYKKATEINISLTDTKNSLEAKTTEKNRLAERIEISNKSHTDYSKKLNTAIKDKYELENSNIAYILAKSLEEGMPCPVCGSPEHPNIAKEVVSYAIGNLEKDISDLTEKVNVLSNDIYNDNVASAKLDTEISTKKSLITSLTEELKQNLDNMPLNDLYAKLETLEHDYKTKLSEQKLLEKQKKESENNLTEANKIASSLNTKIATLKERIQKDEVSETSYKTELEILNKKYTELTYECNNQKNELSVESFLNEQKEINKKDKQLPKYEIEESKMQAELKAAHTEKERLQTEIHKYETELQGIIVLGQEKQENIQKQNSKIKDVCHDKDPEEYLKQTSQKKKKINKDFESAQTNYESLLKQSETIYTKEIENNENKRFLEEQLKQQNVALDDIMIKNNVSDRGFVIEKNLSKKQKQELQSKYKKYIDDVKTCQDNIIRLEQKLHGKNAQEINLEEQIKEKEQINEDSKNAIEKIAIKKEKLNKAKEYMPIVNSYRQRAKVLAKKQDLLLELKSVFVGSKFVEYIAESELQYISKEASQRLKFITRGRYELLYTKRDFFIVDNYNGKISRGTETLSGGELFLASLALALALSSKIQLKSAPLEFFFLDEGFGSLDSHLLDIVVSSLENLKDQRLTVGLITHVDEIKNRLPVRLSVTPPNHGIHGSKVSID